MKKAFTLIELMIVIVIIGIVYSLAISKIKEPLKKTTQKPTLLTLKSYLSGFMQGAEKVSIVCGDRCTECTIYRDNKLVSKIDSFVDANIKSYRYDFFLGAVALPKHENCFTFSVYKNGISNQIIVVDKGKAYDYTSYFTKTKAYDSLQDAVAAKKQLQEAVSDI